MSWDPVWDKIFKERTEWGKYPPEELVRFIAKNYYSVSDRSVMKVLEVGCGPGAGPGWYIAREGFSYYGIDGSPTAIEKSKQRFIKNDLKGEFVVGFLNQLPWPDDMFGCVIDIAALQCNSEKETKSIINEIWRVLKTGGKHFSLTSKNACWGDGKGIKIDDTSYKDVTEGPFAMMGIIRFATEKSIKELYRDFNKVDLEYSIRSMNNCHNEISNWIVTCEK